MNLPHQQRQAMCRPCVHYGSIVRLVPYRYRTVPFSSSGREPWLTPVLTAKCFDTPLHQPLDPSCTAGVYAFAHLDDTIQEAHLLKTFGHRWSRGIDTSKVLPSFRSCSYLGPVGRAYFGIVVATKKEAQNALTWLAGQTDRPHDGRRCPGYWLCDCDCRSRQ